MYRLAYHTVCGKSAFQHCAAGKVDDFHFEDRFFFINDVRDRDAAAFYAIFPQLFNFIHCLSPWY